MLEDQSNAGGAPADDLDLELAAITPAHKPEERKQDDKPAIPEKYVNKSVEDLIQMHQNLEREKSRQANELGELRRTVDQIISVKPVVDNAQKPETKPVTVEALLDNPTEALSRAFDTSPVAEAARKATTRVDALERRLAYGDFYRTHPKFQEDLQNPEFIEWLQKNPTRLALAQQADKYNFDAAQSLWGMWDEYKDLKGTQKVEQANVAATKASTVRESPADRSTGGPVYARSKLMDLRIRAQSGDRAARAKLEDPGFQRRLELAYAEGRVR